MKKYNTKKPRQQVKKKRSRQQSNMLAWKQDETKIRKTYKTQTE